MSRKDRFLNKIDKRLKKYGMTTYTEYLEFVHFVMDESDKTLDEVNSRLDSGIEHPEIRIKVLGECNKMFVNNLYDMIRKARRLQNYDK